MINESVNTYTPNRLILLLARILAYVPRKNSDLNYGLFSPYSQESIFIAMAGTCRGAPLK